MIITLPWPAPGLAPNRRNGKHWTATHAAKLSAGHDAAILTLQAMRAQGYTAPAEGPIALSLTFCPPDARRRDLDGLLSSLKKALDSVAQTIGVDDVRFEPITLRRGKKVSGGVVIVEVGDAT